MKVHELKTHAVCRVGILSDTHGALDERVPGVLGDCNCVVHAGDIGASWILDALSQQFDCFVAVRGNNDTPGKWVGEDRDRIADLPLEGTLALPGGDLVVVHGHRAGAARGRHQRLRRAYPNARAIVYGHSHRLLLDTEAEPWVINPGAAGRARTYGGPSCVILQATPREWKLDTRRFEPRTGRRRAAG